MRHIKYISTNGDGFWGTSKEPKRVSVTKVVFDKKFDTYVNVYFNPETWNVEKDGLIYTDRGFLKEVKKWLKKKYPTKNIMSLEYTEQGMQGDNYVSLELIVPPTKD